MIEKFVLTSTIDYFKSNTVVFLFNFYGFTFSLFFWHNRCLSFDLVIILFGLFIFSPVVLTTLLCMNFIAVCALIKSIGDEIFLHLLTSVFLLSSILFAHTAEVIQHLLR